MRTISKNAGGSEVALILCLMTVIGPLHAQTQTTPPQNAIDGSRVFGRKGCPQCHSINGIGGTEGPDLASNPKSRTFYDLAAAMWNHTSVMVERMGELGIERPTLDPEEAGDLIAFLYSLDYFDPPGDTVLGHRLFTEKGCVSCHQIRGSGGVIGPNLGVPGRRVVPIELAAAMWNHGPAMTQMMQARGIRRPTFSGSELVDLIAYIEAGNAGPPREPVYVLPGPTNDGRQVFVDKGCVTCHAVAGRGGGVGPDLVRRGVHRNLVAFAAAMWNKAPAMIEAMRRRGISVPQLEPEEVADLVGYLYSVGYFVQSGDAQRGRRVVTTKGCLGCHAFRDGGSSTAAPDLATGGQINSPAAVVSTLWNHALLMGGADRASWATLRPEEIADLGAYLQSLAAAARQ